MTELAVPEQPHNSAVAVPQGAVQPMPADLMQWVESARQASLLAKSLAKTSFAGQYRGKPEEATAAILSGWELGIQPMASLKSIDVIQGQPALRAHAMRALVQSKGHDIELVESTPTRCVMRGRRKGAEDWQEVTWTTERAGQLGLLGKDQWKKQPGTMLIARATGEMCRLIASDALHGLAYVAEELSGTTALTVEQVKAPLSVAALTAAPTPIRPTPIAEPDVIDPTADDAEHAAAVAELHAFGAEMDAPDIEADAFQELGVPLEDASAQSIRELTARYRAAAA